jgi:predicted HTH transcriptional regulator
MLKNYRKNRTFYGSIRFVVTSETNKQQLQQILAEEPMADPVKYRIDVIEFESLNMVEPPISEDKSKGGEAPLETWDNGQHLAKAEEKILSFIVAHGYRSREEVSQKCNEAGIDISVRSVSRYLKVLTEKGLLRKQGNSYVPTEPSKNQKRQATV